MSAAERQRRYRQRLVEGSVVLPIEVSDALIEMAIDLRHLPIDKSSDRKVAAEALARMFNEAADAHVRSKKKSCK